MSRKLPSEFRQTTPAKPKALPRPHAHMAAGANCDRARKRATGAASHRDLCGYCAAIPETDGRSAVRIGHGRPRRRKFVPRPERDRRPAHFGNRSNSVAKPQLSDIKPKSASVPHPFTALQPLFFCQLAPYIEGAGSPAMEINGRRNKPFGPGGSTRRLHQSPPFMDGFRRGRNRIDEGVKGEFFLGMVPPLSGYAIVANDNYAPVAQAA